jgi:hypothetical protein
MSHRVLHDCRVWGIDIHSTEDSLELQHTWRFHSIPSEECTLDSHIQLDILHIHNEWNRELWCSIPSGGTVRSWESGIYCVEIAVVPNANTRVVVLGCDMLERDACTGIWTTGYGELSWINAWRRFATVGRISFPNWTTTSDEVWYLDQRR